jgi:hypothetical protein
MHSQHPSPSPGDQFSIDISAFIVESIPDSGIKLLRPKPENESALSRQLDIPRRLEILRRSAARETHPHTIATTLLQGDLGDRTDTLVLQDVAQVGESALGELVFLILTAVVESARWRAGWGLGIVPAGETEAWQAYLAGVREQIVRELGGQQQQQQQPT